MSNKAAFKMSEMNEVIFRKAADKSVGVRFMSLFPGKCIDYQELGMSSSLTNDGSLSC
jgi:hypothetical protein